MELKQKQLKELEEICKRHFGRDIDQVELVSIAHQLVQLVSESLCIVEEIHCEVEPMEAKVEILPQMHKVVKIPTPAFDLNEYETINEQEPTAQGF